MKKSKLVASALATVFAVSACGGALIACNGVEAPEGVHQIEFDANGGVFAESVITTLATVDGALVALPSQDPTRDDGYVFNGYTVNQDGTGGAVVVGTEFDADATVYAQWKVEGEEEVDPPEEEGFTITFDLTGGAFASGVPTTHKTKNGKLTAVPSDPTKDGYYFVGYSLTAGDETDTMTRVQLAGYTFTKNTTLYAVWSDKEVEIRPDPNPDPRPDPTPIDPVEDGDYTISVNGTKYEMTKYERQETDQDTRLYEYQLPSITLKAGDVVTFNFKGDENATADGAISFWVSGEGPNACNGIAADTTQKVSTVKVTNSGTFGIYVKWYNDDDPCFVLNMSDGTASGVTDPATLREFSLVTENGTELAKFETWTPDANAWLEFAATVTLDAGQKVRIYAYDAPTAFGEYGYNNYENYNNDWDYGTTENGYFTATKDGKFSFYLKIYDEDGNRTEASNTCWVGYKPTYKNVALTVEGGKTVTLDDNTESMSGGAPNLLYEFMATGVEFAEGDVVSFSIAGDALTAFNTDGCHGVTIDGSTIAIDADGTYNIYMRYYDETEENGTKKPACWTIEFTDGKQDVLTDNYYLVGSLADWNHPAAKYELKNDTIELKITAGTKIKIAKSSDGSTTDWATALGYGDITKGAGYVVDGGDGGNIQFRATDTYTIKIVDGKDAENKPCKKIEITAANVSEVVFDTNAYYLVGETSSWGSPSADHKLDATNGFELYIEAGTEIKIAKCSKAGATIWDGALGYSAVALASRGYVTSAGDDGTNIKFNKSGTYTIKVVDGKVEITSDDVELPPVTAIPFSAKLKFNSGDEVTLVFDDPGWSDIKRDEVTLYIWQGEGAAKIEPVGWPGKTLDKDGEVEINVGNMDITQGVNLIIIFKQNSGTKQSKDKTDVKLTASGTYILSVSGWDGDQWIMGVA